MKQLWLAAGVACMSLIFLGIGALASGQMDQLSPLASSIAITVIALPSYYYLIRKTGLGRGIMIILVLNCLAIGLETLAIITGIPYGWFVYSEGSIGEKLFGVTPWTVGLAWSPLVLGATAIALSIGSAVRQSIWKTVLAAVAILVAFDLVLDPAAVTMRIWSYADPGSYYGVPLSNYLGWIVSGALGVGATIGMLRPTRSLPFSTSISMLFSLLFWFGVSLERGLVLPTIFGSMLLIGYAYLAAQAWMRTRTS